MGESTLWTALTVAPANATVCLLNLVIFFVMWNYRVGLENVAISYETAITQRQYYRIVTATFSHLNVLHVGFNVSALFQFGDIWESTLGTLWYLKATVWFIVVAGVLDLVIIKVASTRFPAWMQVRV